MGDLTEGEKGVLPKRQVDRNAIQRLIKKLQSPETLEQVTGGTPAPIEELTEQGKSPIDPLDNFLEGTTPTKEQVKEGE